MAESLITVRIIHFDDEVNTVSNIPASLYNYFVSRCEGWMREEETVTRRYIESFVVRPPSGDAVRVEYHLMADVDECRELLKTFNVRTDIAIFDLMRQADKGIEPIGRDLYLQMRQSQRGGDANIHPHRIPSSLRGILPRIQHPLRSNVPQADAFE